MKREQAAQEQAVAAAGRRDFLKLASVGAAAGTVAAAIGGTREAEAAAPEAQAKGYRETAHVKRFYELARF